MHRLTTWVAGAALMMVLGCSDEHSSADMVVTGAIRTMDPSAPVAEAMAIAGGKILFVGDVRRALLDGHGRTIALAPEQMVMPGLVDSHVHMLEAGILQLRCAVDNPKTKEALFAAIKACADANPNLEWVLGSGWPLVLFDERGPRKEELDALIPNRPAVFYGQDGHSAWLNSVALRAADIGPKTLDPMLGRIERVSGTTEPSGTLRETAVDLVEAYVPPPDPATYRDGLTILARAYTIQGAIMNHRANETGSLEVGKAADFIILDRNLFEVAPDQIGETQVLATFVNGAQVYASSGAPSAAAEDPLR